MTPRQTAAEGRHGEAGVTLVEVLVAMVLFALIATAGYSVLSQVVRVQAQTDGRLQRIAQLQRTMNIVTQDFMFASSGSLSFANGAVSFRRSAGDGEMAVRYDLEDQTLVRTVSGIVGGQPARQVLLPGVAALRWAFLDREAKWNPTWPPPQTLAKQPGNPAAVAVGMTVTGVGLSGDLERIAILPAEVDR